MKSEINAGLTSLPSHESSAGHVIQPWQVPLSCLAYASLAAVALATSFTLWHLGLMPYNLGRFELLAIAMLSLFPAFYADKTIKQHSCASLFAAAAITSFVVSALGLVIMAPDTGGDLLRFIWHMMAPGFNDRNSVTSADADRMYAGMNHGARLCLALLSLCMPVTAGLAVNRSRNSLEQSINETETY